MARISLAAASMLFAVAAPCQTFFPPPPAPTQNPTTTQKALLGFVLFHEEQLSSDNTVACKSCHHFTTNGTDARTPGTHPGYDGTFGTADDIAGSSGMTKRQANGAYAMTANGFAPQATPRKAPSVINVGYARKLFYDGRAQDGDFRDPVTNQVVATGSTALENLVAQPPLNPVEMGHQGRTWSQVATKIAQSQPLALADQVPARIANFVANQSYPALFARAFGTPEVTPTRIIFAISAYLRTLVADRSRYDYALAGGVQLTALEQQGRTLFEAGNPFGFPAGPAACTQCHGDITAQSHVGGPSAENTTPYGQTPTGNFHMTGLRPVAEDLGRGGITGVAGDQGRFKAPFLRNVTLQTTFGHNGQLRSIAEVVDFYSRGGDFHQGQATEIQARNYTATEKTAVAAFLATLTDPRVAAGQEPFDTVRLASERGGFRPTMVGSGSSGGGVRTPTAVAQEPVFLGTPNVTLAVKDIAPANWVALGLDTASNPAGVDVLGVRVYLGGQATAVAALGISSVAGDGSGFWSSTFSVPNLPQFAGLTLTGQWFSVDSTAPAGIATSAGFDIRL